MLQVDLHTHSIYSLCGNHTALELLKFGADLGIRALAITDHGLTLGGRFSNTFFDRFHCPYPEIRLLKGIECNLLEAPGEIDIPKHLLKYMDVVLLGIHPNTPTGMGVAYYTDRLCQAMEKNPCVDIITHPDTPAYPLDFEVVATLAKKLGMALELNNSKILLGRHNTAMIGAMLNAVKNVNGRLVINSDTHGITELGQDQHARTFINKFDFPKELIINDQLESAMQFIEERRVYKQ